MRAGRDAVVQRDDARVFRLEPRHRAREGVAQPGHDLEQREVGVGELGPDEMTVAGLVARQHVLEIAEVFRDPRLAEVGGCGARPPGLWSS